MFFLGLLVLCAASFLFGFGVRRMLVVPLVALLGISAVVADQLTGDLEDPVLVATVQLLCTAVIAGCSALGVVTRRANRHRTR
jgi:L-cystine uptake protein TcyP (sodium:dicarboxylate symporter family)